MLLPIPIHKFLLDENVKIKLFKLLKSQGFDVKLSPKSASDKKVAAISGKESRILVTNDEDFKWCTDNEVFAVIWLRIPQNDSKSLINIFEKLTKKMKKFEGKFIELNSTDWEESLLFTDYET